MDVENAYEIFGEYVARLIRKKAKKLVGRCGFTELDIKDLEQELALDLLRRLPQYDPAQASHNTFCNHIINHHVATIIQSRSAGKRDYKLDAGSLNDVVKDADGQATQRLDRVDEEACRKRAGWLSSAPEDMHDLAIDFELVFSSLPPELRELCERRTTQNITDIAKAMDTSRSTIYNRINVLKAILKEKGIDGYL